MKCTIRGDSGESVSIHVINYSHLSSSDVDDSNWLSCVIEISLGSFQAKVKADLRTEDFVHFGDSIEKLKKAENAKISVFETLEQWLKLEIEKNHLGRLIIKGESRDVDTSFNRSLSFEFYSDQKELNKLLSDINVIRESFPVIKDN